MNRFKEDVVQEKNEENSTLQDTMKKFTICIQASCPKIKIKILTNSKLDIVSNNLYLKFDDQQKHKQIKLVTSGVYCSGKKGILFTTDGRGCLPSIDSQV